jgi:hypothetical protein
MSARESRSRHVQFRDGGRLFAQAGSVGFINKVGATTYRDYAKSKSGEPQKFSALAAGWSLGVGRSV